MRHYAVTYQRLDLQAALTDLGRSLGRLIYWRDAIDDYQKDEKSGSFNPLTYLSPKVLANLAKEELQRLKSTSETIPWIRNGDVIQSIVNHSVAHHQDMASISNRGLTSKKKKRAKKKKNKDSCCDYFDFCDCCPCGFGCDSC